MFPILSVLLLTTLINALSVVIPNQNTKWARTAGVNSISWTSMPYPNGAGTTMNIRIINNEVNLYSPLLNVQFQAGIDFIAQNTLSFVLGNQLAEGINYQILFVSPTDPTVIYAKSELFSIVADANAVSGAPIIPTPQVSAPAPVIASSTSSAASSKDTSLNGGSGSQQAVLRAAIIPGGQTEQGLGYAYLSAGGKLSSSSSMMISLAVLGCAWLLV